jgi:hypothetical protein
MLGLRMVVGLDRGAVGLDLLVDLRQPPGELALCLDARFARVTVEKRPVDRHDLSAHQIELAQHQYELPVHRLERQPVVLAELGNGAIARHQVLHQPYQFEVAAGLALQAARRSDPVEVAIKIKLQKVGRVVRRLPSPAGRTGMAEPQLPESQRSDKSLDNANRVVLSHVIINTWRKKALLIPADAGLENAIRHAESYIRSAKF